MFQAVPGQTERSLRHYQIWVRLGWKKHRVKIFGMCPPNGHIRLSWVGLFLEVSYVQVNFSGLSQVIGCKLWSEPILYAGKVSLFRSGQVALASSGLFCWDDEISEQYSRVCLVGRTIGDGASIYWCLVVEQAGDGTVPRGIFAEYPSRPHPLISRGRPHPQLMSSSSVSHGRLDLFFCFMALPPCFLPSSSVLLPLTGPT